MGQAYDVKNRMKKYICGKGSHPTHGQNGRLLFNFLYNYGHSLVDKLIIVSKCLLGYALFLKKVSVKNSLP